MGGKNEYMEEVLQQQANVAQEMRKMRSPSASPAQQQMMNAPAMPIAQRAGAPAPAGGGGGGAAAMLPPSTGNPVDIRVTGFWRFKTVIVPPNAWVVHTRRGEEQPLHLGLGVSFSFDPERDSYLVAPATMQTLAINARCICKERQGIMVQAYVQWSIDDFKSAYKKLDFSDVTDPMRIVTAQLREQAEASIKDKVASMSIDEVLADRAPIIEELTARLRSVAERQGLKIEQVQIKEAIVSSTTLWENLQKPFREEKAQLARLAELERERTVEAREVQVRTEAERARIAGDAETERIRRAQEVELAKSRGELEEVRVTAELQQIEAQQQLDAARADAELAALQKLIEKQKTENEARIERERLQIELDGEKKRLENDVSAERLQELLVKSLPQIASNLPRAAKSETITIAGDGANDGALALAGLLKSLRSLVAKSPE